MREQKCRLPAKRICSFGPREYRCCRKGETEYIEARAGEQSVRAAGRQILDRGAIGPSAGAKAQQAGVVCSGKAESEDPPDTLDAWLRGLPIEDPSAECCAPKHEPPREPAGVWTPGDGAVTRADKLRSIHEFHARICYSLFRVDVGGWDKWVWAAVNDAITFLCKEYGQTEDEAIAALYRYAYYAAWLVAREPPSGWKSRMVGWRRGPGAWSPSKIKTVKYKMEEENLPILRDKRRCGDSEDRPLPDLRESRFVGGKVLKFDKLANAYYSVGVWGDRTYLTPPESPKEDSKPKPSDLVSLAMVQSLTEES